jgi:hypothetical protein
LDKRALVSLIKQQTKGRGGMADNIPGMIKETGEPIAVSHGEFVLPADIVSLIGDGSSEEGARILTQFMQEIRKSKGKQLAKGKQANPLNQLMKG